jgi:hypothetical protein
MADLKDTMKEVAGTIDNHETSEGGGEGDLEEVVVLNCFRAPIQRPTNRMGNSYCMESRSMDLKSDMVDCVGTSRDCVEGAVD